jgi:hypothetical protein
VYGQAVHFTATISVPAPGAGNPTGPVQFIIDNQNFGQPVEMSAGSATSPDISSLAVAGHAISATYLGDANFSSSSAPVITQTVNQADTTLILSSNLNPSPYGMSVLITAKLTGNPPSTAIPDSGTVPLNTAGEAHKLLPYTALWVGTHQITAVYSGNASFNASDNLAAPFEQVVEKGTLVITLEPTVEDPVYGQLVSFSVKITSSSSNNPVPTGTVQFGVDGASLGSPATLDSNGEAHST